MKGGNLSISGKARFIRIGCVLLLLCLALSGCGQPAEEKAEEAATDTAVAVSPEPTPEPTPEPPEKAELLHVCDESSGEYCLAASADGTRFLVCKPVNAKWGFDLWVQNADGGDRQDLYLAGITEEESENDIGVLGVPTDFIIKWEKDQIQRWIDEQKEQYGSYAGALVHLMWRNLRPDCVEVAGDLALLVDYSSGATARINLRTGETVFPGYGTPMIAGDGTILCVNSYARSFDEADAFWLRPDQAVPDKAKYLLPDIIHTSHGSVLMEDQTVWMLARGNVEKVKKGDRTITYCDLSVVHCDSSGNVLRRVAGGRFDTSLLPSCIIYSEKTGVGIVYSNMSMGGDLWYFGPDDDTLKPLVLQSMLPPTLSVGEREEVMDESGRPTDASRPLYVCGLSEGSTKLLVQDFETRYLLSLDLRTLQADILMTAEEIRAFEGENSDGRYIQMYHTGWNGRLVISCGRVLPGYAVRLPFREAD